ncbi:MAG: YcgN family cysteine cluster protein [Hyphomicrobiaceae bacterium]|nr:YcgN family cysteine cluster protein [Hyphomicrobiaceae bacterium]
MAEQPFWETKSLDAMSETEWESLCDGCGRCCLLKLEDEDTGEIATCAVSCRLFDLKSGRCSDYANRFERVPDCLKVTPDFVRTTRWLPSSCAYRRIAEGRGLAAWHPLISGRAETVVAAGVSVLGRVVSERDVREEDLEDHVTGEFDDPQKE